MAEEEIKPLSDVEWDQLKNVEQFPGIIEEYEKFKGYEVEIIDTGRPNKGVSVYGELWAKETTKVVRHLVDEGIEAIVGQYIPTKFYLAHVGEYGSIETLIHIDFYGLPIRKKKSLGNK